MNSDKLLLDTMSAERDLCGVLLAGASFENDSWLDLARSLGLRTQDFLSQDYRRVWEAMQFIHDGGDIPNWAVVVACLREADYFSSGWSETEIARMATETLAASAYVAEALARAVHRYAEERRERAQILTQANTALDAVGEQPRGIQREPTEEMPT